MSRLATDALDLLCGKKLGEGVYRTVFECALRSDWVVKLEIHDDAKRTFANVHEWSFWDEYQSEGAITRWLAPCEKLSPDGRILLQQRCEPIPLDYHLPQKLPAFLTDVKRSNFGLLDGKLVCVDYAFVDVTPSTRLKNAHWA